MDTLQLFQQGQYEQAIQLAQEQLHPSSDLVGAEAAFYMGNLALAEWFIARNAPYSDSAQEAERLVMVGRIAYHRGDVTSYRRYTLQAANLAPSFMTLYFLGRSQPPCLGLITLREALAIAQIPDQIGRAAHGMAQNLWLLGRLKEALPYASLATLHSTNPYYFLTWATMALLASDDIAIGDIRRQILPLLDHPSPQIQIDTMALLAQMAFLEGDFSQALRYFELLAPQLIPSQWPFFAFLGLCIYRSLGQPDQITRLAQAVQVAAPLSELHRGMAHLIKGLAQYPDAEAATPLQAAYHVLKEESPLEALKAAAYLAALDNHPMEAPFQDLLGQWALRAQGLLFPAVTAPDSYEQLHLEVLGQARLTSSLKAIALRPRSMELLVLLISQPEGWSRDALAEALYGYPNRIALQVELRRLKQALGGGIAPKPWRLTVSIRADFLELRARLHRGDLAGSLALFRGPLLPQSLAPGIEELRTVLEQDIRNTVLVGRQLNDLLRLAELLPDDPEVWETLAQVTPPEDPRYPAVVARLRRLHQELLH
jgi:hypothetical protein